MIFIIIVYKISTIVGRATNNGERVKKVGGINIHHYYKRYYSAGTHKLFIGLLSEWVWILKTPSHYKSITYNRLA